MFDFVCPKKVFNPPKPSCNALFGNKMLSIGNCSDRLFYCHELTEACRVLSLKVFVCLFSVSLSISWSDHWVNLLGLRLLGKAGKGLKRFPLRNNLSNCKMIDFKLFGNQLPTLIGSNNCISKIICDIFPPRHCVG